MSTEAKIAREISYANSIRGRGGRAFVRVVENLTGRPRLIRMAQGYEKDVATGQDFWQVMVRKYGIDLQIINGALENIPKTGPLVVVSNHPFGILDGMVMGNILSQTRGDFRILAHNVFQRAEEINRVILPVSFDQTKEALRLNLNTRKSALEYLAQGGAIGVFPGGSVSTSNGPFGVPMDPRWRRFTAKLVAKSEATVVPIFFDGTNGRLFQIVSQYSDVLRKSLLINEFRRGIKRPARLVVGEPLSPEALAAYRTKSRELMIFLREATYKLSPKPLKSQDYGFEFEDWD
ncbi:MAG: lysophospholipid acyltransferase family protein [Rhodobacteraceae bacterium]|nr:lysophospholipid acyltransferase family protein [Paracoccaceae bacterium]